MSNNVAKSKVANAFRAMKAIGIAEAKVKPVLKNLLKLYYKNWELIEEENYRALADAIFEREELEAQEQSKKIVNTEVAEHSKKRLNTQGEDDSDEAQATEEHEQPLKRLRLRHRGGQASSINTSNEGTVQTLLVQPKEEPDETIVPQTNGSMSTIKSPQPTGASATTESQAVIYQSAGRDKGKQPVSAEPLAINERCDLPMPSSMSKHKGKAQVETEPRSHSHPMRLRGRRAEATSPQSTSKDKRPVPDSSAALCLKEPKPEPDIIPSPDKKKSTSSHVLITPKDEPVMDAMPCSEAPVVNSTATSKGKSSLSRHGVLTENCSSEPLALQPPSEKETAHGDVILNQPSNGDPQMILGECSSNIEITSSPSGEVRIYLNSDLACGRSDFKMPSLEEILKCVEDKYLRSPQTLGPDISLMNIMKEICQCFLDFGTNSHRQSQNTVDTIQPPDPSSKYPAPDGLVADGFCMSTWNSLDDPQSTGKLPECRTSVPCRHNVNDGEQTTMNVGEEIALDGENQVSCVPETNALSLEVVQQSSVTPCNGVDEAVQLNKMGTRDDTVVNTVNPEKDAHETNCLSLETPQILTPLHPAVDITKGLEKVVITLVNEVNDEGPPSFYYIPQNAAFQNAYVNFFLARIGDKNCCASCSGDCLSSPTVCACALETGGEFAYTSDGLVKEELLKECISMNRDPKKHCQYFCKECPLERSKCADIIEPCKGHLVRKFIKECWWKCGCNKQCGNRVVQRGISCNLQVFMTPGGKGWGLRTLEDLPKGAFVCEYVGEVLTNAELFERVLKSPEGEKHSYPVLLDADWCAEAVLKDEDALCLDATYYGNVARFINHRCYDSNLVEIPVEVETPDHHYYHLAFFTTRKVKAMEELTWDYGIDFDDHEHPIKAFRCHCGSRFCRNIKRSRSRSRR